MTLIICEKDNAAKRIASILSNSSEKREAHNKVSVYRFTRDGDDYAVMGLRGHILNLDYPKELNQWSRVEPRDLIDVEPIKQITATGITKVLKTLAKENDNVIIATDFDREGELIGVEGLHIAEQQNKKITATRARFSALTSHEVNTAFQGASGIDYNLSDAAETRQVIDLAWGASLTRFISLTGEQVGKDFLSVGRVQSPTLALIVDKEKEIRAFVPKQYWEIVATLKCDGVNFDIACSKNRIWEGDRAKALFENVRGESTARVLSRRTRIKKDQPPTPFDTTTFLRVVNTLGVTPTRAMSLAEELYTNGYISYPRTDNTVYPASLDLGEILRDLANGELGELSGLAAKLLEKEELVPTRGKKSTTDHPPIHPVGAPRRSEMDREHWKVYELIVRRFFATLADPSSSEVVSAAFDMGSVEFQASGTTLKYKGWKEFYPYSMKKEVLLPPFKKDDELDARDIQLLDKMTKAPGRYSQGGLIQEMDRLGLGTKSTRHEIISKLFERGYIENKPPQPSLSGFAVIDTLEKYAAVITKHDMTSTLENDMDLISQGEREKGSVIAESRIMLNRIFDDLEANREQIGRDLKKALYAQNVVGTCPRCGHEMYATKSKWGKRFIKCSYYPQCQNSYPLPQRGKLIFDKESCSACGSPVVKLIRKGKRPWVFCVNMHCSTKDVEGRKNDEQKG